MQAPRIETLTEQEVFEHTARFLFEQGEQSLIDPNRSTCAYRGDGGKRCAVGFWIRDEDYDPNMDPYDGNSVEALIRDFDLEYLEKHEDLLKCLQQVHDGHDVWKSSETMREALRQWGAEFELNTDFLDTLSFKDR